MGTLQVPCLTTYLSGFSTTTIYPKPDSKFWVPDRGPG